MSGVIMVMLVVLAAVAQPGLGLPAWAGQAGAPLLLCVVLYYALNRSMVQALVAALAAGVAQDTLSELPLGYSCVAFAVAAGSAGRFRELISRGQFMPLALIGAAASFGVALALGLAAASAGPRPWPAWLSVWRALWAGALGFPAFPILFAVVSWLERRVGAALVSEDETGVA